MSEYIERTIEKWVREDLEGDGDFRTKEGIRVCSAEGLLREMV
jgi:hypothetical protein